MRALVVACLIVALSVLAYAATLVPVHIPEQPGHDYNPSLTTDGRLMVYDSIRTGTDFLFMMDTQTGTETAIPVAGQRRAENPSISGNGRYVAFLTGRYDASKDIFLYDRETSQMVDTPGLSSP